MKCLLRGYLKEAQWFSQKYVPTLEEHRELSLITCTYPTLITIAYVGMGDVVTKETFDWMLTNPKIVEASSIVSRFMDDIVGHKVCIYTIEIKKLKVIAASFSCLIFIFS